MAEPNTHLEIDPALCGTVVSLETGMRAVTEFEALDVMRADDRGLVHGGFVFGLADYAAMLAVNDPNVVLGKASVRFTAPVKVGDRVVATAKVRGQESSKWEVHVEAVVDDEVVFDGTFTAFVLDEHVLA